MHIILFHFYSKKPNPVYQEIASALRRRGHTVWVGAANNNGDLEWRDDKRLIAVQAGPAPLSNRLRGSRMIAGILHRMQSLIFVWRVRQYFRKVQPDIIQVNPTAFTWMLPWSMPATTSFVLDIRQINENVAHSFLANTRERQLIHTWKVLYRRMYDHICFCHEQAADRVLGENWTKWGTVVPVGVHPRFRQQFKLDTLTKQVKKQIRFVYLGTLSKIRKLERLLFSAKLLLSETDDFQLDLIGPDTAEGFYHNLRDKLGLDAAVNIKPPIPYEQVPEVLASYEVGLAYVPDRPTWHYQPTVKILEYRAVGMPIISTNVASHREIVQSEVNGLLVEDSAHDIMAAMRRFIKNSDFLEQTTINALQMRESTTTWDQVALMYERNVYRKLAMN